MGLVVNGPMGAAQVIVVAASSTFEVFGLGSVVLGFSFARVDLCRGIAEQRVMFLVPIFLLTIEVVDPEMATDRFERVGIGSEGLVGARNEIAYGWWTPKVGQPDGCDKLRGRRKYRSKKTSGGLGERTG